MENWLVVSAGEWTTLIRAELDTALDKPLTYDGTIDGAWTGVGGVVAGNAAQYFADGISSMLLATAPPVVVAARAEDRGLTPRPATPTVLTVELLTGTEGVLPVGTELKVEAGDVTIEDEAQGVTLPFLDSRWVVVENQFPADLIEPPNPVIIQCTTAGRVIPTNPLDLKPVAAIPGIEILRYSGTAETFGRVAERTSETRQRVENARANISGTDPGIVTGLLQGLPTWLIAAGVISTPGFVEVSIAPAPPTDADEQDLAETLYKLRSAGTGMIGIQSRVITGADGQPVTVNWQVGGTTDVLVDMTITPAKNVTQDDANTAARDGVRAVFSVLGPGDVLLYVRAYGSLNQASIDGADLTLNGFQDDVTPASTNILVPVFVAPA